MIKTDASGDTIWTKIINGGELGGLENGECFQETNDGGFIFTGQKVDDDNLWLVKTNQAGDTLWTKTYFLDGNTEGNSFVCNVIETNEGEYILGGGMNVTMVNDQAFLIKTNSFGDTLWTKQFIDCEYGISAVRETTDGGYIIAGEKQCGADEWETWLYNTDSSGKKNWETIIWEGENGGAELVHELLNGDYICSVNMHKESYPIADIWIIRLNQNGDTLSTKLLLENVPFIDIQFTSDGGFIILSKEEGYPSRLSLIKTAPDLTGFGNSLKTNLPKEYRLRQNYPNPFNPSTTIEFDLPSASDVRIEVYNTAGQKIHTLINEKMPAGSHQIEFNAQNLSSGVYFYNIEAGEFQDVKKMILLR